MGEQGVVGRYDLVILGGGPAGGSAAINAAARRRTALIVEAEVPFARVRRSTHAVNNYLGLPGVSGNELADAFLRHLQSLAIPYVLERAVQVVPVEEGFQVYTDRNRYHGGAVVLACGLVHSAGIPGEQAFLGRGVSYCATCDGVLFSGRQVVVVGEYPEAEHDALTLARMASQVRYLPTYGEPVMPLGDIELLAGVPEAIEGNDTVTGLRVSGRLVRADGVFVIRPSLPPASLVPGLAVEEGYVHTERDQSTGVAGVYAAGDITGPPFQYAKSVGQGQVAALAADRWLQVQRKEGAPAPGKG